MTDIHLHDELSQNPARVVVETQYGPVTGGRATSGATAFLGVPSTSSLAVIHGT